MLDFRRCGATADRNGTTAAPIGLREGVAGGARVGVVSKEERKRVLRLVEKSQGMAAVREKREKELGGPAVAAERTR